MFEEMDDKFELDLIHDEIDYLEEENITESEMKMQRRKTLYDVSIVNRKDSSSVLLNGKMEMIHVHAPRMIYCILYIQTYIIYCKFPYALRAFPPHVIFPKLT